MKTGIHEKIPMADYLASTALSSGMCHTLLTQSPFHAWHDSALNPNLERENSKTADIGVYAHAMLLEGGLDKLVIVEADDWRTKAAREQRDEAYASGKLPILGCKVDEVAEMREAAYAYIHESEIAGVFDHGKPELTMVWQEGDIMCRARPDWLTDDRSILLHYKTTAGSVSPTSFSRTITNSGYAQAVQFYYRGLGTLEPETLRKTRHIIFCQDQARPFACALYELAPSLETIASSQIDRAIETWKQCVARQKWPAYEGRVIAIEAKPWEIAQAEEDMLTADELSGGMAP